ncbi:hypothetical protein EDB81DRAFT_128457 [Dactylonectria macrodidyma]|uniref:Uncharacterized protein n=1 Tax=Dactylonectria macrodidyma TaxID=307937 RepID=A0A9P9E9G0_9HYPO|nr:hypothetical protein EDB81DRAFT_128457 [Dactylonectria macrodidyma]
MVKMLARHLPLLFASSLPLFLTSYAAPLEPDGAIEARDDDDVSAQWTWLHFEGCDSKQKQAIKDAHEDAVTMALHVENIDFANDPGAMDFFGPSALNKDWQKNIQSVFDHIGTFRLSDVWPGYKMNARCGTANDKKYQNRCNRPGVIAYQWNTKTDATDPNNAPRYDKDDALSNMHFCDQFFYYKKLNDAIKDQKDSDDFKWRYDLIKYKNQAYIILHEMMHASVMTYKQNKNRRIPDLSMHVYEYVQKPDSRDWKRKLVKVDVYQPYYCKVLARTAREKIAEEGITMNADNYAQYALSKYVQSKLDGNQYPWLPIADKQAQDWYERSFALLVYGDDGTFGVNTAALPSDVATNNDDDKDYTANDLGDDEVVELANDPDTDTLAPDSDYSEDFQNELRQWAGYVRTPAPKCAGSAVDRIAFPASDAEAAIKDFCSEDGLYGNVFVPPINMGTGRTTDGKGKALGASGNYETNGGKDKIWVGAYFAGGSCIGSITWPPTGAGLRDTDLCMDRFRTVLNGVCVLLRPPLFPLTLTDNLYSVTRTPRRANTAEVSRMSVW